MFNCKRKRHVRHYTNEINSREGIIHAHVTKISKSQQFSDSLCEFFNAKVIRNILKL